LALEIENGTLVIQYIGDFAKLFKSSCYM